MSVHACCWRWVKATRRRQWRYGVRREVLGLRQTPVCGLHVSRKGRSSLHGLGRHAHSGRRHIYSLTAHKRRCLFRDCAVWPSRHVDLRNVEAHLPTAAGQINQPLSRARFGAEMIDCLYSRPPIIQALEHASSDACGNCSTSRTSEIRHSTCPQ